MVDIGQIPTVVLLPNVVPDFHARYPQVKLKSVSGFYEHLRPTLQQGLVELAITAVPDDGPGAGVESKVLFQSEIVVVGRRGHPKMEATSLRELIDCEWILLGTPGGPGGTITRFFAERGLDGPQVAAACESFT